jgi:hypothetical protein
LARATSQLASWPEIGGTELWLDFRSLAATLCFYSALVGLLARQDYQNAKLLMHSRAKTPKIDRALVTMLPPLAVVNGDAWKSLIGYESRRLGGSDFLFDLLKVDARQITLTEDETADLLDRLEYLVTLEFAHVRLATPQVHFWTPVGRYVWRTGSREKQRDWVKSESVVLLRAGLLGGTDASCSKALAAVDEHLKTVSSY